MSSFETSGSQDPKSGGPYPAQNAHYSGGANGASAGQQPPPEQEFDVRQVFGILWGRIGLIIFCVIVLGALGVFQLRRSTPTYSATAVIKYEPRLPTLVEMREMSSFLYQRDEMATASELIRSPAVARRVLEALGEEPSEPPRDVSPVARVRGGYRDAVNWIRSQLVTFEPEPRDPDMDRVHLAANRLLGGLTVRRRGDTKLIEIRYEGSNNREVARIANEFANQFIAMTNEENREAFSYARDYLSTQIEENRVQLQAAERRLFDFSGQYDLRVLDEHLNISIGTLTDLNKSVEETRNEIALLEAQERAAQVREYWPLLLDDDGFYGGLRRRLVDLQIQRTTLAAENEPRWPALRRTEREIEGITEQIEAATEMALLNATNRLEVARMRLSSLEDRLEQQRLKVRDLEEQMIEFRVYQREVETNRAIYGNLLDQYKRLEASDDIQPSNVTIVASAIQPQTPSSPNVPRTMAMFLFLGAVAGVGLAFGLNYLDRSVRSPSRVEELLQLPSLGFIPYAGRFHKRSLFNRGKRPIPPMIDVAARDNHAEAFHYLRTSIQYSTAVHAPQTILVTSCFPQEGKSTVASNLAAFFASRGERVLLIDADLKKPMVHRMFKVPRSPGLSDVLAGQATPNEAIVSGGLENLDLLPVGTATPSPINLLDSQAMSDLLGDMRLNYGTIILDSAPCYGMADSLVLANKVDGVCIVVRIGSTPMEVLHKASDKLRFVGANILGVVYNSTRVLKASQYGGYGYGAYGGYKGYGYGYGYGYQYKEDLAEDEETIPSKSAKRQEETKV